MLSILLYKISNHIKQYLTQIYNLKFHFFLEHTSAESGDLHAANTCFGGFGSVMNCLTNSNPSPLFAPVIKTLSGDNSASIVFYRLFLSHQIMRAVECVSVV